MSECSVVNERIPLLLTESLSGDERESAHLHLETCAACAEEWKTARAVWAELQALPEVAVPPQLRSRFLAAVDQMGGASNVVPLVRRQPMYRRFAQVAAAALLVVAGWGGARVMSPGTASVSGQVASANSGAVRLAEQMRIPSSSLAPAIEGNPDIRNVQFVDRGDGSIGLAFDLTSRMTVEGRPGDRNMDRLVSYILKNDEHSTLARSSAIQWVRDAYASQSSTADPELVNTLAQLVRNDSHEGLKIRAVEALSAMPASSALSARGALIDALRNDPNPAVRIKAIEALAAMGSDAAMNDPAMLDTLREKASQEDENPYVRVKAAEVLGSLEL